MTVEENCAYIHSQVACALIECAAMQAANSQNPDSQPYNDQHFKDLIDKYGIYHNAIIRSIENSYR